MPWILRVYFPTTVVLYKSKFKFNSQNMTAQDSALVPELPRAATGTECGNDTYVEVPTHMDSSVSKLPYSL